ncbi:sensor histidine kinase [Spirillospora sp. NPDC127200]
MITAAASSSRRWAASHPLAVDTALALTLTLGSSFWAVHEPGRAETPADDVSRLLTLAVNLPLAGRRRAPFTALLISCTAAFAYHGLGYHYGLNNMGPLLALYTVAAHRSAAVTAAGGALTVAEWTHAVHRQPDIEPWSAFGQSATVCAVAMAIGAGVRLLAERNRQLADLTGQLRREQEAGRRRAVVDERVRIARELHDIVAHHMSVVSVQAGLARYVLRSDPATAEKAMRTVAETSGEGLSELRRLLSVLRMASDGSGSDTRTAGLPHLDKLIDRVRAAHVPVEVDVTGTRRPLPPGMDLCAYRVLQEALTNVLKHAGPVRTQVRLDYGPAELTVHVVNAAPPTSREPAGPPGHGLAGMSERVRLYGGTLATGPLPDGGFEVRAVLPLPVPADAPLPGLAGGDR